MKVNRIRLITRADDAGSNESANSAIRDAVNSGLVRNVSFMTTCDALEEAVGLFRDDEEVCCGVHLTMNAEWNRVKWGPVAPIDQVRSLIDAEGFFHPTPEAMRQAGAKVDELFIEMAAQLERLRKAGITVRYADEHMVFGRVFDGFENRFDLWCKQERLVNHRKFTRRLPHPTVSIAPLIDLVGTLNLAEPGVYTWVTHPAYDSDEMRQLVHAGLEEGRIARERDADARLMTSEELKRALLERDIALIRYDEA